MAARPGRSGGGRGVPVPRAGRSPAPGVAGGSPAGDCHRSGLLPGRSSRAKARRRVPPQRPGGAVRPDRPGAAGTLTRLGPGAALRRDDRPPTSRWQGDPATPGNGGRPIRRRAGTLHDPGRAAPARTAGRPRLRPRGGRATLGPSPTASNSAFSADFRATGTGDSRGSVRGLTETPDQPATADGA